MRCALALLLAGCSLGPTGDVRIDLEAEDTISRGLASGTSEEDVIDGWSVTYTQFIATIGDVRIARSATSTMQHRPTRTVVDLRSLPASGFPLASFASLEVARWDVLDFTTPPASVDAVRDASVSPADLDEMIAGGCTFLIAGVLTDASETSVAFHLCIPADTGYGPCSTPDGMSGIAVVPSATTPAHITIHGDHLWFDSFPSGAEAIVERRAQWMVDCDHDHDGHVTEAELRATPAARVLTTTHHYDLAGAPTVDGHGIQTAWDFVRAQMSTVGHFQGEGECPWAPAPPGI
jgi:hypothetical protein